MIIIGITGTLGAGKGTIVDFLVKNKNFKHYSVREFLMKEIKKRGLEASRDTMTEVANNLRAIHSPSYIVEELYKEATNNGQNCVIESLRTPGEITSLRNKDNFYLFAVDAKPKERYARITQRLSETDNVSYETFIANENREMESKDENKQNIKRCIEMADFTFENNGNIDELNSKVNDVINLILEKHE